MGKSAKMGYLGQACNVGKNRVGIGDALDVYRLGLLVDDCSIVRGLGAGHELAINPVSLEGD
jgi:hypothetical protein